MLHLRACARRQRLPWMSGWTGPKRRGDPADGVRRIAARLVLLFQLGRGRAPFGADDMMNIAAHWRPNPWRLLYSPFLLWHDFYRPLGGLFYVPIFWKFGLNPWPFHAALLALLLINAALLYRLARLLGATELAAWLAALIAAYHAGLVNLYWDTAHVYDALCAVFSRPR